MITAVASAAASTRARAVGGAGFGEAIEIMRFCGEYDLLYHIADETHHDRPAQRAPEDAQAELQRQYIKAAEEMKRIAERIERGLMRAS